MYIKISNVNYTEIQNLSFAPQIDITGDEMPINEFVVEIKTTATIKVSRYAYLYDDLDQLWAKFWIVFADRVNEKFVRVRAQSPIALLDRYDRMPAAIYTSAISIGTALDTVFSRISSKASYTLDASLQSKTIKGYFPEQTPRERLQWICFACNAYVKQAFTDKIEIKALDQNTVTTIPIEQTYWKPEVEYKDYVTAIKIHCYSFASGTPAKNDNYVTVNGTDYIISESTFQLTNPDSEASTAAPNVIEVEGMYLAHDGNASSLASRLALLYFARREVKAAIINNKEYQPAQKVNLSIDEEKDATGYISSMEFAFGVQAKSELNVVSCELRALAKLTLNYKYNGAKIATKYYSFPVGYQYQITNQYIDKSAKNHRYIYRPLNQYATGTMTSGTNINNQNTAIALHLFKKTKVLYIISVSDIEFDSEDKVVEIE